MKKFEVLYLDSKKARLTVTPDRITIKIPKKMDEECVSLIDQLTKVAALHETTKYALRGRVLKYTIHLYNTHNKMIAKHKLNEL